MMEQVNKNELRMILGGKVVKCEDVIAEGNAHSGDDGFNWDAWLKDFDEFCG